VVVLKNMDTESLTMLVIVVWLHYRKI